jgi:iron(II)-dependent oxidoreductase
MASPSVLTHDRGILAQRLADARSRTDEIFSLLRPEALYERPIPERHRMVFYLGHLEAFDWNLIARGTYRVEPFHEAYDRLFAFGIDPVGAGLPNEPASDWPSREEIDIYNRRVRETVDICLAGRGAPGPHGPSPELTEWDVATVFNMAIEHRLMHAETLAYLLHQLPPDSKHPHIDPPLSARARPQEDRVNIPAGRATLGQSRESQSFGWDNEFETLGVDVPAFAIDRHKITNGRYLEFVRAGGYREQRFWTDADFDWLQRERVAHPRFWRPQGDGWLYRGMFGEPELPLEAPVYVSHAEASAFARWAGGSLPTEAQFHRAAYGTPGRDEREYPWGAQAPADHHGNFDFSRWDPTPIGAYPAGDSAFGVSELVGNGWEWTQSLFEPFPGFRAHPLYEGYSANFFDRKHYVLKGGSPRTAACMLRRSFRNWFQPHYPYAYATFRLVAQ